MSGAPIKWSETTLAVFFGRFSLAMILLNVCVSTTAAFFILLMAITAIIQRRNLITPCSYL